MRDFLAIAFIGFLVAGVADFIGEDKAVLAQQHKEAMEQIESIRNDDENKTEEQVIAEKAVEAPAPTPAPKPVAEEWDPNNCEPDQYISAEDKKCIPKPTIAASPVVQPPSAAPTPVASTGCEQYRGLLSQYDWNVETMMYAMRAESGCNPYAVGDDYVIAGVYAPSCGLLQVRTLPGRPSCEALKDPATNVAASYQIWLNQGYGAWTTLH